MAEHTKHDYSPRGIGHTLGTWRGFGVRWKVRNPYIIAMISTMGGMLFGFDISSMSAFLNNPAYKSMFFAHPDPANDAVKQAGITSSMPGGSFVGSLCSGYLSDKLGRRTTIQLASFIWMIGAAIQSSVQNLTQLVFGRLIAGFAIGLASSQVPVYIAELSPKNIRGRLVGLFQWAVTWGILIMFYISYGLGKIHTDAGFRIAWGIQIIPGLILCIGTLFLDESPRWLASKDRWDEAINIISLVQARGDRDNDEVRVEIEEIKEAVRIEHETAKSTGRLFLSMFTGRTNFVRTMTGIWTQIWQQLTGMNVMMYYIVNVFAMAGYSGDANLIASSIQYIINCAMTVPALLFIDKWGRRRVMISGAILMMAWLFALGSILAVYSVPTGPDGYEGNNGVRIYIPKDQKPASKGAIAVCYLFVATFAPTWGPVGWIYVSELFPLQQRALANGVCAAANWIFNFGIGMFTPVAFVNITWKTYFIFATFCGTMAIHVFFMFPETHRKSLEEIDMMWNEHVPAWRSSSWEPSFRPDIDDIKAVNGGRAPSIEKPEAAHNELVDDISDISGKDEELKV
ncbi:High-affinity glucose transporter [Wickerhamiella sorbophila]|uniref:High-affinity glucose transporter n=1 Tax=Wickerhamiella sorbophila TaxID=45607 RepID=A0A2T0FKL7_9ASCO|nr:High-affinity glucose transporter [Wickerhamiella sorbophila]PRT55528.1 High-affinity glucose transporter [Wickerhamiella sorbophila]